MKKAWLSLGLVAWLVVGCGEPTAPESDVVGASEDDLTSKGGPNGWQLQGATFDCTTTVSGKVSKSSRRHVLAFDAKAGQVTTFDLKATWPATLGARIYVTDEAGKVLATEKAPGQSAVSTKVSFEATGTYLVYVSPIKHTLVEKTYSYQLAASCSGVLCESDSDCTDGARCQKILCKGPNCHPSASCVGSPKCATATVPPAAEGLSSTYYVQNVASDAEAQSFYQSFPQGTTFSTLSGACSDSTMCPALYNPVCGVVRNEPAKTFSNACAFSAAIRLDAGAVAGQGSKGYIESQGECVEAPVCSYDDPSKSYVVQSAEQCKLVKFACPAGAAPFFDDCGCGCETTPVCDYNDPGKKYVAQSPEKCQLVKFACEAGWTAFFDDCGCGCASK